MNDSFDIYRKDFSDELDRVKNLIDFIDSLREFGSIQLSNTNDDNDEFTKYSMQIHAKEKSLSTDIPILSGTILLYIVGRFENFVKISFESLCDAIATKSKTFNDLPEQMRKNIISLTAEVMAHPSRYGFDDVEVQTFIQNLSDNMQASQGMGRINSACLSITEQNMRPGILAELYKRVGINSLWLEVSKQSKLKVFFEESNDQQVERYAKGMLEEIMSIRNQIAHPSAIPTFPDGKKIKNYINFFVLLSELLIDVCRVHLSAHKTNS